MSPPLRRLRGKEGPPRCPGCGGMELQGFFDLRRTPRRSNFLCASLHEALTVPLGRVSLVLCRSCSLVFNTSFDPRSLDYSGDYENSLSHSPAFRVHARAEAARLVRGYRLRRKIVVEVGCGDGGTLALLARLGGNRCIGFDPSIRPRSFRTGGGGTVRLVRGRYPGRGRPLHADLVVCAQVLEHIARPLPFLLGIRRALKGRPGCAVYFEVPNLEHTLRRGGIWDVLYEHCNYFSRDSLARLFSRAGFEPRRVRRTYHGQFLALEAVLPRAPGGPRPASPARVARVGSGPRPAGGRDVDALAESAARFDRRFHASVDAWRRDLLRVREAGGRTAIWGAGSKGVTFLNALRDSALLVDRVVDVSPRKQGCFVPGTGHPILPPTALEEDPPDLVLVMNPIYRREVAGFLQAMGLHPRILTA